MSAFFWFYSNFSLVFQHKKLITALVKYFGEKETEEKQNEIPEVSCIKVLGIQQCH